MSGLKNYLEYDVRAYFEQFTQFEGKSVLDFGCHRANFVRFKPHGNYVGMDIKQDTINKNKFEFPQYKFEYYNGYNYMYNPTGDEELNLKNHYDVCVAYSVFTHHTFEEARDIIKKLKEKCGEIYLHIFQTKISFPMKQCVGSETCNQTCGKRYRVTKSFTLKQISGYGLFTMTTGWRRN